MSILHPMWVSSAVQIEVWKGNEWCRRGSGILIRTENGHHVVTARHVVDEQFVEGPKGRAPFDRIRIRNPMFVSFGVGGQDFVEWTADWKFDADENDLAATQMPDADSGFYRAISADAILDKEQLNSLQIGHSLIMSGFPAMGGLCDETPLMVGRQGVLASHPLREISIQGTLGRNYFLLDSFAQSGFSGAPLFAFERPEFSVASPISFGVIKVNGETISEGSEPQRLTYPRVQAGLAGIVCGHFRSAHDRQDGGHAGLSYCVAAHRINSLIEP